MASETYLSAVSNAMKHLVLPRTDSSASLMKNLQEKKIDVPLIIVEPGEIKTKMSDVGGYDEAKVEIVEFINFINHTDRYLNLGARLPRGALLHGEAGTGKTLLVKATAGEGNIPFLSCACASLVVDQDGVRKLRKIFKIARQLQPCVLFFDEIDAISKERTDPRTPMQSLCITEELLVQLDGFQKQHADKQVITFGATNNFYGVDKALLRPGRFDRVIEMPAPQLDARIEIARIHLRPLKTSLDKDHLASMIGLLTEDLSGASIAAVCNEAAMIAARNLSDEITVEHFNQSLDRVRSGLKKSKAFTEKQKEIFAYHEAGHAVVAWHLPGVELVTKLNIMANAKFEFVCATKNRKQKSGVKTKQELIHDLVVTMSGLAAEEVVYGKYAATGAVDLERATSTIVDMAAGQGHFASMGKVLSKTAYMNEYPTCYQMESKFKCGDQPMEICFNEMKMLISQIHQTAKDLCVKYREQLDKVAAHLVKNNFMNVEDLEKVLGPHRSFDVRKFSRADSVFVLPPSLQAWNVSEY